MTVELFEPIARSRKSESIFPLRDNEPEYARLNDPQTAERNRYGDLIELKTLVDEAVSLNINGVSEVGFNPNRHKQHAFHFTADNCIGCHACESACSEKNDLPPHLSFRSVGYVEGGTYPNYTRMNISMACNHCDDPVCLKGCPTRAYTKHPEYGAVIQDPNICFGCGYCTWVCPYNAPQLDPVAGQVEKCNMCVDRLEVGLKPACVSACLGNALNFGVVENTPENRQQIETSIPGFPDPEITHPNIRFQQTRSMPREVTRTDSMPVKYRRDDKSGRYRPVVDQKAGKQRSWNLGRLSSRENPLVVFTLATQAAVGLMAILFLGNQAGVPSLVALANSPAYPAALLCSLGLVGLGLLMSAMHLGKPLRFYRGFNNYRHSPVAREGLGAMFFMIFTGLHFLCVLPAQDWLQALFPQLESLGGPLGALARVFGLLALVAGATCIYYMYRCYRIKARPFWNHWQTATAFIGTALSLGGIATAALGLPTLLLLGEPVGPLAQCSAVLMLAGLVVEGFGLWRHANDMNIAESEGAVSHYVQCTTFGKTYLLRNALLGMAALALVGFLAAAPTGAGAIVALMVIGSAVAIMALLGRALFYVLVIPTTMPGAFFWKNKGFEEHAREIGLADMPQVGVVPHLH
ncbi:DmsC/YnfH family molybdoenzyme membrane anchor subunit [Haliea sp. E17]|uniref:DmsC/YnfH family molybdoenzyme membrane anchor subunit n=1 Tax=Haliea sp. E17 TaxID=3401576 RepID=UPI003AAD5170